MGTVVDRLEQLQVGIQPAKEGQRRGIVAVRLFLAPRDQVERARVHNHRLVTVTLEQTAHPRRVRADFQ